MKDNSKKLIFTEDLDYSQTGNTSIWGDGDSETITTLQKLLSENKIFGKWLHFAAGDGRYNNILLSQVDKLIATDIDYGSLQKLKRNTPSSLSDKLIITKQNITEKFSFENAYFDGVINTGTLHLFPDSVLDFIFSEVSKKLKVGGMFFFDFATDIKRIKADGSFVGRSKHEYTKDDSKRMLSTILKKNGFTFELIESKVLPEEVTSGDGTYMFSCNYWLIIAYKR